MSAQSPVVNAEPQLNATPLIDVLLVLLVMLIFTLPIATHSVRLNLPQAGRGTPSPAVRLEITYGGDIYWNDERLPSPDALASKLRGVAALADAPLIKVIPEKRARYELVAQVLAAAQRSHVEKLTVMPVPDP